MKTEIDKFDPCDEALEFRRQFKTFREAWENCPIGSWMIWLAIRLKVDERKLFLAKGLCAQTVVHLMKDERSVNAVNAAIAYGKGEISSEELKTAYEVAAAVYTYTPDVVSIIVADASVTPYLSTDRGQAAADAAAAYAAAAYAFGVDAATAAADAVFINTATIEDINYINATAEAAKKINEMQTADICREVLTEEVLSKLKQNRN